MKRRRRRSLCSLPAGSRATRAIDASRLRILLSAAGATMGNDVFRQHGGAVCHVPSSLACPCKAGMCSHAVPNARTVRTYTQHPGWLAGRQRRPRRTPPLNAQ